MPYRHVARNTARRPQRRKLIWVTSSVNSGAIAAGSNWSVDMVAGMRVAGASLLGTTVMRIHAQLEVNSGAATAGSFNWFGIKIADQVEITTTLALSSSVYDDWMIYDQVFSHFTGATVDATVIRSIDLRSKRKMEEMSQTLGLFVSNTSGVAQTYNWYSRTLLALP